MSLRLTVLICVAVLLILSFSAVGGLTTRVTPYQEVVVLKSSDSAVPEIHTQTGTRSEPPALGRRFYFALAAIAAVTLFGALLLADRLLVAPIRGLTEAVRRVERGSLDTRVPVTRTDEIGDLARSFNDLAERLQRSEERRKALTADIAHELRTPLTNIRGSIEAIQDGIVAASPEELHALHDDALLLERLVADLHLLSLGDANMLELRRVPIDLESEVRTALAPAGARAVLESDASLPPVEGDAARLRQVLGNILANALRYSPAGVPIVVHLRRVADGVTVSVEDGGPGFPPDQAEAIFERFHRLDDSRSRETGGTGLGLSIARKLVEAHGGRIGAYVNERGGATIWFTLPAAA